MSRRDNKVDFRMLTNKQCSYIDKKGHRCHKKLKQNLVDKRPDANMCYAHWLVTHKSPENVNWKYMHLIGK